MERAHRLTRSADYLRVRKTGRSWAHPLVLLQMTPHEGDIRFGMVVSKRVGKAHDRNKAKRRLRAICRQWLPRLRGGCDVVLVARPGVATVEFTQLEVAVAALFRRAGLLRTPP